MPYEATVPVHRRLLWPAVTDAERLIGALPNASIDASGTQGVAGRLRVRTRDQTVTFRGVARIVEVVPASLRVSLEVEAVFGRAGGTVEGVVEITLRQSGPGTRVVVGGQLEIVPGAAPLSAEALDSAFQRVVQRWFAALAETSPAAKPSASEPAAEPESADLASQPQPTRPQPADDLPSRPRSKRAPLAVVRDLSADQERGGNGSAAPTQLPEPATPEPQDSNASNGWPKPERHEPDGDTGTDDTGTHGASTDDTSADGTRTPARGAEPHPPTPPLRLVTPSPDPAEPAENGPDPQPVNGEADAEPEVGVGGEAALEAQAEPENTAEPAQAALVTEDATAPVEPEPEDIWSRLRDRSLPPWIPFLVGAATATLAALAFILTALRRRYRRR